MAVRSAHVALRFSKVDRLGGLEPGHRPWSRTDLLREVVGAEHEVQQGRNGQAGDRRPDITTS